MEDSEYTAEDGIDFDIQIGVEPDGCERFDVDVVGGLRGDTSDQIDRVKYTSRGDLYRAECDLGNRVVTIYRRHGTAPLWEWMCFGMLTNTGKLASVPAGDQCLCAAVAGAEQALGYVELWS